MRTENVKVTMEIPVHFDKPDCNGFIYIKEAWEKAVKDANNLPLEIIHDDGSSTVIGVTQDIRLVEKENGGMCIVSGTLFHGGTCEKVEIAENKVTNLRLSSVGFTK